MRTGSISLTIDSEFQHVFLVGIAVQQICSWIPLSDQSAFEMEMAVVEAVNNSNRARLPQSIRSSNYYAHEAQRGSDHLRHF